jgi:hypothetical protein
MESWNAGPHSYELEPPDVLHFHIRAPVEGSAVEEGLRICQEELEEKRGIRIYMIAHVESPDFTFTPSARNVLFHMRRDAVKAFVLVGGTPMMRAATNILGRSLNLLWGNPMPFKMVGTAEEARRYIEELRAKEAVE